MTYAASKKSSKTPIATAPITNASPPCSDENFPSFVRTVSSAGPRLLLLVGLPGGKADLNSWSGRDIRRCSLDSTNDCHFSKRIASNCARISFIHSMSPAQIGPTFRSDPIARPGVLGLAAQVLQRGGQSLHLPRATRARLIAQYVGSNQVDLAV
jgi:hypothetical protein